MEDDETGGGSLSLVFPLVEYNGCHKIKVAVLLQRAIPSLSSRPLSCLGCWDGPACAVFPALPLGGDCWGALALLVALIKT